MKTDTTKTVLITGGTSGLGRSLVSVFLDAGWNVATLGRRSSLIEELQIQKQSEKLLADACDIRIEKQVERFFDAVREKFETLDVCVLNAGTLGPADLPNISNLDILDLRMTFETNFFSHFNVLKKCLELANGDQLLVHITSDVVNEAYPGWGAYGSSKVAMDFIFRTLNNELGKNGVQAISVDPGDMDTEMHRIALPEDSNLKDPDESAREIFEEIEKKLEEKHNESIHS